MSEWPLKIQVHTQLSFFLNIPSFAAGPPGRAYRADDDKKLCLHVSIVRCGAAVLSCWISANPLAKQPKQTLTWLFLTSRAVEYYFVD